MSYPIVILRTKSFSGDIWHKANYEAPYKEKYKDQVLSFQNDFLGLSLKTPLLSIGLYISDHKKITVRLISNIKTAGDYLLLETRLVEEIDFFSDILDKQISEYMFDHFGENIDRYLPLTFYLDNEIIEQILGFSFSEKYPNLTDNYEVSQNKPIELKGNWTKGFALQLHTLKSTHLASGANFGFYDTTYTPLGKQLYELKYQLKKNNAINLAGSTYFALMKHKLFDQKIDLIIPVPPSNKKRSFQPVFEIAGSLSKFTKIPVAFDILSKKGEELKGVSDIDERIKTLENSIIVEKPDSINGKSILLVDDLYRSGATLNTITKRLKENGAKNIFVITITKTRTIR